MYKKQVYEEETFKTTCASAYQKTVEEAKKKGVNLNDYYFSQYLTSALNTSDTLGMVTYLLDDGTDDTSFCVEILFNENGDFIQSTSDLEQD